MSQITVIIPSYNYGAYLAEAIESVLVQTRKPLEIIVMDDASTDNTAEVAGRYPVCYIKNRVNLGLIENFNKGVSLAKGEYVMFLGADDRLRPDYLAKTAATLDEDPTVAIVYTYMALFGPYAESIYKNQPARQAGREGEFHLWRVRKFDPHRLEIGNYIHGSSLFLKQAFEEAGGFTQASRSEDWQLWRKIVQHGWVAQLVPEYLLEYRQHSHNQRNVAGIPILVIYLKRIVKTAIFRLGLNNY